MTSSIALSPAPAWCRSGCECGRARGSATRAQMRVYAVAVTVALVGRSVCVHCDAPVSIHNGQVDRLTAGCYAPGNVMMICEACNNGLGQFRNLIDGERLASDVARVSAGVTLPSLSESVRAYRSKPDVSESFARSPYRI